jgi:hypothetical protein
MEKSTINKEPKCESCKSNKGVIKTQRFLVGFGIILFSLAMYGLVSLILDLKAIF